jgi:hypothetical protein
MKNNSTISITFGDVAENHKGMQQVGKIADCGFDLNDLNIMKSWFESNNSKCELVGLHMFLEEKDRCGNEAYILIVKNGVNALLNDINGADKMLEEQNNLEKDKKAIMYGRVVNKHARHNLCFGDTNQEPNYYEGKGRIYAFEEVPNLKRIRKKIYEMVGEKGNQLQAEGNYYYDSKKCGIGYHGDTERRKVFAIRLGESIPLCYSWFKGGNKVGEIMRFDDLSHGDIYVMSEKTTGYDWKRKNIYTLRHAAGADKYIRIPEKKERNLL